MDAGNYPCPDPAAAGRVAAVRMQAFSLLCKSPVRVMSIPLKPYVKPQPPSKNELRAMLAQAVRNTDPELNPVSAPVPEKVKRRGHPAKIKATGRKDRA
jgi:hypothetical protein